MPSLVPPVSSSRTASQEKPSAQLNPVHANFLELADKIAAYQKNLAREQMDLIAKKYGVDMNINKEPLPQRSAFTRVVPKP